MKQEKILITGGLGFIGSLLGRYLLDNNCKVMVYDTGFFKDCVFTPLTDVEHIIGDMRFFDENLLDGVTSVVHLAGISNDPVGNLSPDKIYDPTRDYAVTMAKACKKRGVKFIFASSCSIYGRGNDSFLDETSETFPQTPYSLNKLQIEQELEKLTDESFSPISLRFATAYGFSPRIRFDLFINMLVGMAITRNEIVLNSDGKAWRPSVHVSDICKSVYFAIKHVTSANEHLILNVGNDKDNYTIIDIAKFINEKLPGSSLRFLGAEKKLTTEEELVRDRKIKDGVDTRTYRIKFTKIHETFSGFKCDWDVPSGIENLIAVLKKLKLNESEFKNPNYYRLQKMESLYKIGKIDQNFYWKK